MEEIQKLPPVSVRCCVTSPPYWGLRDYGHEGQLGLEATPEEYVEKLVQVFREVRRVLTDDGTLWLNLGDSYAGSRGGGAPSESSTLEGNGHVGGGPKLRSMTASRRRDNVMISGLKPKDLVGIPWRAAFALQADGADTKALAVLDAAHSAIVDAYDGESLPDKALAVLERLQAEQADAKGSSWCLRSDIIWHKPNPMPESVRDRPTKAHEYLFLLAKSKKYYYDAKAMADETVQGSTKGTRNRRTVWTITPKPFKGAHFAVMPEALVEPCILAGSEPGDTVLDSFAGAGTVGVVAARHGREFIGVELNPEYAQMAEERIIMTKGLF
ncbi:hypothetical protein LCGC14_1884460 [marine sediment metagenome]|uniref:site-specific DNA-methyltransferase (cytosine-N(4)-specific) n=1 Tax=marine sediment metagenome TaxID=412755 RepID=A0A0F9G193_9ZZZZ